MLDSLARLGLEVRDLDRARGFYEDRLGLVPARVDGAAVAYGVGDATLALRRPTGPPRGGLHTHYAFAAPPEDVDPWLDRLADLAPEVHEFGTYRSLYVFDPDEHCVEVGGIDDGGQAGDPGDDGSEDGGPVDDAASRDAATLPLTGIFEVVLEVLDLDRAETLYAALGFEPVDRGSERRRVRLRGPMDLELWEPQLGLADARGGVHVDLAFRTADPEAAARAVTERTECADAGTRRVDGEVRVRDPDGHLLSFLPG